MSTPNINNALSHRGVSGDSAPVTPAVTLAKSKAAPAEQSAVTAKNTPSAEQLQNMVEKANKSMDKVSSSLEFTVDNTTNKTVIKVMESQSGKVIMQFPSEEMLSITRAIDHAQKGVLLKEKA
ncbi:MAG: flagellar protein FlaG [Gallionellaceae bacterium]|jgi:flagellar protein FlaG